MVVTADAPSKGTNPSVTSFAAKEGTSDNFGMITIMDDPGVDTVTVAAFAPSIDDREAILAAGTTFHVNPYVTRKWTARDEAKFDDLAFKKVSSKITPDENRELKQMIAARRRDVPGRTAGEIMRTAEHDRLLREMRQVLEKYYVFTKKGRPHN